MYGNGYSGGYSYRTPIRQMSSQELFAERNMLVNRNTYLQQEMGTAQTQARQNPMMQGYCTKYITKLNREFSKNLRRLDTLNNEIMRRQGYRG